MGEVIRLYEVAVEGKVEVRSLDEVLGEKCRGQTRSERGGSCDRDQRRRERSKRAKWSTI